MKKEYQVYKNHHNGTFIGWEVGYERKKKNSHISYVVPVATFYGREAKDNAKFFQFHLMGRQLAE